MTSIGVIGGGNIGKTVGAAWERAGHEVLYRSRSPAPAGDRLDRGRDHPPEVVLLSVPGGAVQELLAEHGGDFAGRIVIDATNDIGGGRFSHPEAYERAPDARFVRALNSLGWGSPAARGLPDARRGVTKRFTACIMCNPSVTHEHTSIVSPQEWEARASSCSSRRRSSPAPATRWPPSAGGCRGWPSSTSTSSMGPRQASLLDLFDGRRQLIVYRAFFEPGVNGWPEHACVGCSMVADQVAHLAHLNARDTTLVFVSRAPQADIERLKARMGWEHTVVHAHRRLRRRLRRRRVARHERVHPRRRPRVPHLLRQQPRRRGDGQHLELPRHHRARAPGGVGGLAGGLPADSAVRVVELARRLRAAGPSEGFLEQVERATVRPGTSTPPLHLEHLAGHEVRVRRGEEGNARRRRPPACRHGRAGTGPRRARSAPAGLAPVIAVPAIEPGAIAFTLTCRRAHSRASERVKPIRPALAAA